MVLKLFSPTSAAKQVKDSKEANGARALEIQGLIANKLRELADAEGQFDEALQRQRNQWSAEEQEHANKVLKTSKEVEALEERRKAALVPLSTREKELENIGSALVLREKRVAQAEGASEEKESLLEHRLDEVGEREQQVIKREHTLSISEAGIRRQAEEVKRGSELLTTAIVKAQKEHLKRDAELDAKERTVWARENSVGEREKIVDMKEKDFQRREHKLADERATLERAIEESKKKYKL